MTLKALKMRLRALFDRTGADADLNDEVRFHLEQEAAKYERGGLPRDEAYRRARLAFGSVEDAKETFRDERGTRGFEDFTADVRYAVRTLWRDRALAVAGVLTLTLGVGATTAVFSAVNAVMLRDLPFPQPERLVQLWEENPDRNWYKQTAAPANYLDWREQVSAFAGVAAYSDFRDNLTLTGRGDPTVLVGMNVTGNFFSVLGIAPRLGRGFDDADDWDAGQRPIVLSHRAWRAHFRGDSSVIGESVSFGGARSWQIVGVMPEHFAFPAADVDVWKPMLWPQTNREQVFFRRAHWLRVVARLKPGVTPDAANAALQTVVRRLQTQYPETNTRMGAGITPLHEWVVGNTKRPLLVLLAAAGVLLLIACANVGNLLLVHSLGRARDVALRFALGATRRRVARQALTESLVLSAVGGVAGFALGWAGARALLALQPAGMLPVSEIALDYRVFVFAIALTAASGMLFGMAPAINATRHSPAEALSSGGRTFASGRVRRWGRHLVVAEVALAAMLMVGAGLLLRSYERVSKVAPGFDPSGVLTASVSTPVSRYDSAAKVFAFFSALGERVEALPGVERAAFVRQLPVTIHSWSSDFSIAGRPLKDAPTEVLHREIMGDYFRVMRVPLLRGRVFTDADRLDAAPVAIINDVLAQQHFKDEDPIGQQVTFTRTPDSTSVWRTIVGVVGSEHQASLTSPKQSEVFAPFMQDWRRTMTLVVRTTGGGDPMTLARPVRQAVRELDSLLAVTDIRAMQDVHAHAMARERFTSTLVLVFALTGVVLALVGVFGVLAQLVQARSRELGIRLALGAQRSQVKWLVMRHGATLLGTGIAVGLVAALGATRVLTTLLYEIEPTDALTYVAVALLIGIAGTIAAWFPARRASAADPVVTLRSD
jgi:predicted permease